MSSARTGSTSRPIDTWQSFSSPAMPASMPVGMGHTIRIRVCRLDAVQVVLAGQRRSGDRVADHVAVANHPFERIFERCTRQPRMPEHVIVPRLGMLTDSNTNARVTRQLLGTPPDLRLFGQHDTCARTRSFAEIHANLGQRRHKVDAVLIPQGIRHAESYAGEGRWLFEHQAALRYSPGLLPRPAFERPGEVTLVGKSRP